MNVLAKGWGEGLGVGSILGLTFNPGPNAGG
jgi:hypothetical protein